MQYVKERRVLSVDHLAREAVVYILFSTLVRP